MTNASFSARLKQSEGAVFVEQLIAFLPLLFFFLASWQLMELCASDLVVKRSGGNGHYRLTDRARGAGYRIGEQERFLLSQCDGRQSPDEVCRAFGDRFGEPLSRPELDEFLDMARAEHWFAEESA